MNRLVVKQSIMKRLITTILLAQGSMLITLPAIVQLIPNDIVSTRKYANNYGEQSITKTVHEYEAILLAQGHMLITQTETVHGYKATCTDDPNAIISTRTYANNSGESNRS